MVAGVAGRPLPGLWPIQDFDADFRIEDGETVQSLLAGYAAAEETAEIIATLPDLDTPCAAPMAA